MNFCAACDAPTYRAVHARDNGPLIPYCSACLDLRPIPPPKDPMAKKTAPAALAVAPDTAIEASQAGDAARRMLQQLKALPVTAENAEVVGSILVDVKTRYKELDARMKAITAPMRAAEKGVRDLFRPALTALAEAEALLKQGLSDAARAQQAANAAAMQQAQAALAQGDVRGAALAATTLTPVQAVEGVQMKEVWNFRVVDPNSVPRELCSPDDAKIKAYIAAGARQIPGVLVELGTQVSVRTA